MYRDICNILQFCLLLLHLWLSGRQLFLSSILSSLLVCAKVNAEIYLSDEPANLLKGKSFLQKLLLTLQYIPLFASTAFFRVGTGIIRHSGPYSRVAETSQTFAMFFSVWVSFCFFSFLYILTLAVAKLLLPNLLADITMMEVSICLKL